MAYFSNGDFITRSNDVETVCRRVNPDDWDGDGIPNGGPNGATLSVSSVNLAKLTRLSGPDLPASVSVPAEMQVSYSLVYEGNAASSAADDITVTAIVTDADSGDASTNECATTSIRLELTTICLRAYSSRESCQIHTRHYLN